MHEVYLSLGSNIDDRLWNLHNCRNKLKGLYGEAIKTSSIYKTDAWGFESDPFLNQALVFQINKEPEEILKDILEIENEMGRVRPVKGYISRIIDIDILFIGSIIYRSEKLEIPHPLIQKRMFVLASLKEIAGDLIHPVLNLSISDIHNRCKDDSLVVKYDNQKSHEI